MQLTREAFRERGYAVLPRALLGIDLPRLEAEYRRLETLARATLAGKWQDSPLIAVPEACAAQQLCRIEYLTGASVYLRAALVEPLARLIERIIDEPVTLFKDKCNLKHPGGGGFRPHQDITAYQHFATRYQVSAALMLDAATAANGALELAQDWMKGVADAPLAPTPRGTLAVLPSYQGGERNGDILDEFATRMDWHLIEAEPGDVIVFDSYVPHRSAPNHSQAMRRMLFFTFNLASEGEFYEDYYHAKRAMPDNPIFHVSTPTPHSALPVSACAAPPLPRLFTPGPLNTSATVRAAANTDLGSRSRAAQELTSQLCAEILAISGLGQAFSAIPLQGSGTFALEAMLCSLLCDHDHVLVIENGVYSARMTEICRIHGIRHSVLPLDPMTGFDLTAIEAQLVARCDITHLAAVHFETALGVVNDIDGLARLARAHDCRLLLDTISTFGALAVNPAHDAIDALALSANKCLHGLPGLAFVIARQEALVRRHAPRTLSLDLAAQWRGLQAEHQWRFTPPLQIMRALAQALCEFKAAGGRTARLLHYRRLAERLEQGMARLGFLPLIASAHRAPIIISFAPRPGLAYDIGKLNGFLAARGIEIYPSKHWRADSFRVGVIGELESEDIDLLLAAFQAFIEDSSKQRQEDRMPCP